MKSGNGDEVRDSRDPKKLPIVILQQTGIAQRQSRNESGPRVSQLPPDLTGQIIAEAVNRNALSKMADFLPDITLCRPSFLQGTLFGIESAGVVNAIGRAQGD
ncbi:MAG: hypothetical protein ACO24O_10360, partial [Arenimonas sp.]